MLAFVAERRCEPFVYPMFVPAAHTGMRRMELVRSEVTDLDFEGRTVLVREKKRSRKHTVASRCRACSSRSSEAIWRTTPAATAP
ncbi:MAG: hypothetical protein AAGJ46_01805 [Planctomycetota bacterium]